MSSPQKEKSHDLTPLNLFCVATATTNIRKFIVKTMLKISIQNVLDCCRVLRNLKT